MRTIFDAAGSLVQRLVALDLPSPDNGWNNFERAGQVPPLALVADAVDIPDVGGTVDPLFIVALSFADKTCRRWLSSAHTGGPFEVLRF